MTYGQFRNDELEKASMNYVKRMREEYRMDDDDISPWYYLVFSIFHEPESFILEEIYHERYDEEVS